MRTRMTSTESNSSDQNDNCQPIRMTSTESNSSDQNDNCQPIRITRGGILCEIVNI